MNTNSKIQAAKRANERLLLRMLRNNNMQLPEPIFKVTTYHALDRLKARGRVRYNRRKRRYEILTAGVWK